MLVKCDLRSIHKYCETLQVLDRNRKGLNTCARDCAEGCYQTSHIYDVINKTEIHTLSFQWSIKYSFRLDFTCNTTEHMCVYVHMCIFLYKCFLTNCHLLILDTNGRFICFSFHLMSKEIWRSWKIAQGNNSQLYLLLQSTHSGSH